MQIPANAEYNLSWHQRGGPSSKHSTPKTTSTRHQRPKTVQTSSSALGTTSDDRAMPLAPTAASASPPPPPTTTLPPSSPSRTTTPPVAAAAAADGKGGVPNAGASVAFDNEVGDSGSDDEAEAEAEDEEEGGALSSALARRTCMDASSIGTAAINVGDRGREPPRDQCGLIGEISARAETSAFMSKTQPTGGADPSRPSL